MAGGSDSDIWHAAAERRAVIITKDEDFALWRATSGEPRPAVVWVRVGNTRKAELLRWFEPLLSDVIAALESGEPLIEVE